MFLGKLKGKTENEVYFKVYFSAFVLQVDRSCVSWLSLPSAEENVSTGAVGVRCLQACGIICSGAYADCISQLCHCSPWVGKLFNRINVFCCIDALLFFNKRVCLMLMLQICWPSDMFKVSSSATGFRGQGCHPIFHAVFLFFVLSMKV